MPRCTTICRILPSSAASGTWSAGKVSDRWPRASLLLWIPAGELHRTDERQNDSDDAGTRWDARHVEEDQFGGNDHREGLEKNVRFLPSFHVVTKGCLDRFRPDHKHDERI